MVLTTLILMRHWKNPLLTLHDTFCQKYTMSGRTYGSGSSQSPLFLWSSFLFRKAHLHILQQRAPVLPLSAAVRSEPEVKVLAGCLAEPDSDPTVAVVLPRQADADAVGKADNYFFLAHITCPRRTPPSCLHPARTACSASRATGPGRASRRTTPGSRR
jgi:hypothetical protein